MDYNNIPVGLKLTTQIPLDVKSYVADKNTLSYLGVNDNLAFTYHENLKVFCLKERTTYEWREVKSGEENTGLVPLDFTYPNNIVTFGVTYSNKKYNFFKLEYIQGGIQNIGVNSEVIYKGYNSTNLKHEFKGVKDSVSIDVDSNTTDISLEIKENLQSLGTGVSVYNGFDNTTKKHQIKGFKSNTLSITTLFNDVNIEIPDLSANTIYVNNKYTGGSSNGSKTKPYTTVAAAVTGYIGNGTRNAPEKAGYILYVERGNGTYTETNLNLTIRNLIFYLEAETTLLSINRSNWLIDFDATEGASFTQSHETKLFIYGLLNVYGNGFRNSGTASTTPYTNTSFISIRGNGRISLLLPDDEKASDPTLLRYTLISSGKINPTNANGYSYTFLIEGVGLYSQTQRILELGGQVIEFRDANIVSSYDSDVVLTDYKSILVTGGNLRIYGGDIGADGIIKRNGFIHIEGVQTPSVEMVDVKISGKFSTLITYNHTSSIFDYTNKISVNGVYNSFLNADAVFKNLTTVENTFAINECNLPGFPLFKHASSTANIKIYASSSNKIGAYIIDTLPEYGTYLLASAALPVGARFVNTNSSNVDKNTWKVQTI